MVCDYCNLYQTTNNRNTTFFDFMQGIVDGHLGQRTEIIGDYARGLC